MVQSGCSGRPGGRAGGIRQVVKCPRTRCVSRGLAAGSIHACAWLLSSSQSQAKQAMAADLWREGTLGPVQAVWQAELVPGVDDACRVG
jgi:hypothetical protein